MDAKKPPFSGRPHPLVLALSIAYAGTFLVMPVNAQAQEQAASTAATTVSYAIEKGPLEQVLLTIAHESGKAIAFDPAQVRSLTASSVKGVFRPEDAVRAALQGTGLALAVKADGSLSVSGAVTAPEAPVASLKTITVVAERDQAETSFKVDRTATSTRSDSDLMDLASSVTVVTAKVLETQQATSMEDALRNVSGITYTRDPQGGSSYKIRGYAASVLSNGVAVSSSAADNIFGVERVEVLKGPQSNLSGSGSFGGAVNVVTKKPQAEPLHELTVQYGSHGDAVLALDLSGALSEDKRLTYRLIASGEQQQTAWSGYDGKKSQYFMPQLRWLDDTTDLVAGYQSNRTRTPANRYTFAFSGRPQPTPPTLLGDKSDGMEAQAESFFYNLTQKITPDIKFVSKLNSSTSNSSMRMQVPIDLVSSDPDLLFMVGGRTDSESKEFSGDHYFQFNFPTGPLKHSLSTGVSHSYTKYNSTQYDGDAAYVYINSPEQYPFARVEGTVNNKMKQTGKELGVYVMDQVRWGDFILSGGIRRNHYQSDSQTDYPGYGTYVTPREEAWNTSPSAGLVYNITPTVSTYVNYAQGFMPQFVNVCAGGASKPLQTINKEGGLKFDLLDSKFSVTTAYFELDQQNVLSYNYAGDCYTMIPSQMTKGVELDMQGELAKGLNMIFNFTYSTLSDVSGSIVKFPASPKKKASLWATYDFQGAPLKGFGVGLGVIAYDSSWLDIQYATSMTEASKLPGAARVDSSLYYREKDWSLILGVKNLFDRDLYNFSTSSYYVPVAEGRAATLTFKVNF